MPFLCVSLLWPARVKAQMSNSDKVKRADVVLSTEFPYERATELLRDAVKQFMPRLAAWRKSQHGASLEQRWALLSAELGLASPMQKKWWKVLSEGYGAMGRHYHGLSHLVSLFDHYDHCLVYLQAPRAVALAIWFHDLVYDPKSKENELKSAETFLQFASDAGLSPTERTAVYDMVMLTAKHGSDQMPPTSLDEDFFLDFDMSILGSDKDSYEAYQRNVRLEYSLYPDAAYNHGRGQVLESFAKNLPIYRTRHYQRLFQERALANIAREAAERGSKVVGGSTGETDTGDARPKKKQKH
eukprot:g81673.t1